MAALSPDPEFSVTLGPDEGRVLREVLLVLREMPGLYQRGGGLVRIQKNASEELRGMSRPADAPVICGVGKRNLQPKLADHCAFLGPLIRNGEPVIGSDGDVKLVRKTAPDRLVEQLLAADSWPVPYLEGIAEVPMILPGGRIVSEPGHDSRSGLFLALPAGLTVPPVASRPTAQDIRAALDALTEVVCDFEFEQPHNRSAWLAGVLSHFSRYCYANGSTPLFLVDKNIRGGGGTNLVKSAAAICIGREPTIAEWTQDEVAFKRFITSVAVSGDSMVLLDNVNTPLGNATLDQMLTKTNHTYVPLYRNDNSTLPLYAIWWASGNNVQFSRHSDTVRRSVHIRLDSRLEHPEQRTGFRHNPLIPWVVSERGRLIWAALTLLRGFMVAGSPDQRLRPLGSFEEWGRIVRDCLVWAGEPDPCEKADDLADQADPAAMALGALLRGWQELVRAQGDADGIVVRDAVSALESDEEYCRMQPGRQSSFAMFRSAFAELAGGKRRTPDASQLGYLLRKYRNRVVEGMRLENQAVPNTHDRKWFVRKVEG